MPCWNRCKRFSTSAMPVRVRSAMQDLGPTFVKLGQVLATRVDLLPPEWIAELPELQNAVPALPYADIREQLEAEFGRIQGGRGFAVHCLDLDHFKDVNDTLGHPIGDMLLQQVSARVLAVVRRDDVVARVGGDEFFVLQPHANEAMAAALAARINQTLAEPFLIQGNEVHVTSSIGIARCTAETPTPDTLTMQADLALYRAKEDGRNCFRFHSEAFDREVHERVSISDDLRGAVERGELCLYYQPQVALGTGRIVGAEALLRWKHPQRGLVMPGEFIPLAEELGLIVPIGEWVLRTACQQAASWPADISISVNVSPVQLRNPEFPKLVDRCLKQTGLAPRRLELEMTESVLMQNTEATLETLRQLQETGVGISLDDFGTGYSSLSYLRRFPFNRIKIDRSFVTDIAARPDALAIVRTILMLAESLGMTTTAEGVETDDQRTLLKAVGCQEMQGFLFSAAVPPDAAMRLMQSGAVKDTAAA